MTQPDIGYCESCDEFISWATITKHPQLGGHVVVWTQLEHEVLP